MQARTLLAVFLAISCGTGLARAGNVRIAERPLVGPFTTLQSAVDAALEGESLLVTPGAYAPFTIDGKSVKLYVTGTGQATINGKVSVRNLVAGQHVVLTRLKVTGPSNPAPQPALEILNVSGHVRVVDSQLIGAAYTSWVVASAGTGARVESSLGVVFSGCTIDGGNGFNLAGDPAVDGGIGVQSIGSSLALYGTVVRGGHGSEETTPRGGHGGDAIALTNLGLFASGCTIQGGHAGGGDYVGCNPGGFGGDGIVVDAAQARLLDNSIAAGGGGWSSCGPPSPPGQALSSLNGGIIDLMVGAKRTLSAQRIAPDDANVQLTITGVPGDLVFLMVTLRPAFVWKPAHKGMQLLPSPHFSFALPAGTIGASGSLVVSRTFTIFDGLVPARQFWAQAICIEPGGQPTLTGPAHVLALDAASGPDCNGNARQDAVDVLFGGAPDCNLDLVPDSCEADCNVNLIPDACEIASGAASDCNGNGVPDECDVAAGAPDCNANGVPDPCDIASHASPDLNGNGVPDECEANFATWYVDPAAAPGGNGSPAAPFQDLLAAVSAVFTGDTIVLADGVYLGPRNRDIDLGGRWVTLRSANGPALCTIDCELAGRALAMNLSEVVTLEGISFVRGKSLTYGGAILGTGARLTVRNCVFANCTAGEGGAIRNTLGFVRLESTTFLANAATGGSGNGGAVCVRRSPLTAVDCIFANNLSANGGALYVGSFQQPSAEAVITHCDFLANIGINLGGVAFLEATDSGTRHVFDDCKFSGNSGGHGGGLFARASIDVTSCTFTSNTATHDAGSIWFQGSTTSTVRNSIFWGGSAGGLGKMIYLGGGAIPMTQLTVSSSDVQYGQSGIATSYGILTWGGGNLALDPQFEDPDGPDNNPLTFADNDYTLGASSPCIDAGDNGALIPDLLDVDGDGDTSELVPLDLLHAPRRVDVLSVPDTGVGTAPIVDMGAFERPG